MDSVDLRRVSATLEGFIFAQALRPLMGEADPLAGYGVTYFAQLLAARLNDRDR